MRDFMKKVSWVTLGNVLSMITSVAITIILPRHVSVTEYSYYQMYLLYITYIGCIHLGLPDGIYLRYSGKKYIDIISKPIRAVFWLSSFWEIIICALICCFIRKGSMSDYALFFSLSGCIFVPSLYLKYILLASNRIKEYSCYIVSEKIFVFIALLTLTVIKEFPITTFIKIDIIAKLIAFSYALMQCKELFSISPIKPDYILKEVVQDIKVGLCLMISTVTSNFIVGSIRLLINSRWSIEDFGKVSLSLQISNFILLFVRAISLPLFPLIRNKEKNDVTALYRDIRLVLTSAVLIFMLLYFPLAGFLRFWLPDYMESINYLGLLLPICLFEAKQVLLCETYLKNYRKEKFLLLINILAMIFSILVGYIITFIFNSLQGAIYFILIILCVRSTISEIYLSRFLGVKVWMDILKETMIVTFFVVFNSMLSTWSSCALYFISIVIFIFDNRKKYARLLQKVKLS